MRALWIAAAGAAGALARYAVGSAVGAPRDAFPWATFAVNLTGSLAIGLVLALTAERVQISDTTRAALTIGFLGAYTTFSTFSYETMRLIDAGRSTLAATYVLASLLGGLGAVFAGHALGRNL